MRLCVMDVVSIPYLAFDGNVPSVPITICVLYVTIVISILYDTGFTELQILGVKGIILSWFANWSACLMLQITGHIRDRCLY